MEKETVVSVDDEPPLKKLKQGRLPFKPLDHSGQSGDGNTPPKANKKRKLSGNESPSTKLIRTNAIGLQNQKPTVADGEHEVSSSSEADNHLDNLNKPGLNTIDKFFRPKPKSNNDQDEITSTNQGVEILDLTGEASNESNEPAEKSKSKTDDKVADTIKASIASKRDSNDSDMKNKSKIDDNVAGLSKASIESKKGSNDSYMKSKPKPDDKVAATKKNDKNKPRTNNKGADTRKKAVDCSKNETDNEMKAIENDEKNEDDDTEGTNAKKTEATISEGDKEKEVPDEDNKANEDKTADKDKADDDDEMEEEEEGDASFIANTSVCEDALKTPGNDKKLESVLKTPISGGTPSQGSASEGTPKSGKKMGKPLSESKKKDREAQRQRIKEMKEKEREERRLQKEKEKEEKKKELAEKKRQKDEQKEIEKAEKEKLKQEEKEKKEKEKMEKLKLKEEERKAKEKELEVKKEEKRKKEEEKKQKEEEKMKEEEEKQRKKEKKAEMFKGFFIKKDPAVSPPKEKEIKNGPFMPFEVKANMRLAPQHRRSSMSCTAKQSLDELILKQELSTTYLAGIKSGNFVAGTCEKTFPRQPVDDDVELLSHEKETIEKVTHHVKFLKFHENTRPPYYGTWRKKSHKLSPRNPFKQDEELFDYEVDSDDEWEEEEPGESVSSDENDDDEEKGTVGEDEDGEADGWMVPHGYLSDGEGIEDEDEVDSASKQDLQRVRQAAWESELKRQAKPMKMLTIGCHWQDDTTTIAAQQLEILLKFKAVCMMEGPIGTSITRTDTAIETADKQEEKTVKGLQKKAVPEEAMPDLIRLLHGNQSGLKKLVKEFRMYWRKKTNPETDDSTATLDNSKLDNSKLDSSADVDEKTDKDSSLLDTSVSKSLNDSKIESQDVFTFSKRQLEIKIPQVAVREKRPDHKKICWYVHGEVLKQYGMEDITLPNTWEYVCVKKPDVVTLKVEEAVKEASAAAPTKPVPSIMQFAQPMTVSEIQAQVAAKAEKDKQLEMQAQAIAKAARERQLAIQAQEAASKLAKENAMLALSNTIPIDKALVTDNWTSTPGKVVGVPDQLSIKAMFSPGTRKSLNVGSLKPESKSTPTETITIDSDDSNEEAQTPISKPGTSKSDPPMSIEKQSTPIRASGSKEGSGSGLSSNSQISVQKQSTPIRASGPKEGSGSGLCSNLPALNKMMSSPELMKTSPKQEKSQETCEEPMEVDIIVLD